MPLLTYPNLPTSLMQYQRSPYNPVHYQLPIPPEAHAVEAEEDHVKQYQVKAGHPD